MVKLKNVFKPPIFDQKAFPRSQIKEHFKPDQMAGSELIQWSNNTEYLTSYKSENPRTFINEFSNLKAS